MENTLVTVIVPIYNVEKYLRKCVDSILGQTYSFLEIILVDDGSTDSSSALCDEIKTKDERIKVIHKSNGGLSSSRNAGLKQAKGDYVLFIDGDDWINKNAVKKMYEAIKQSNADVVKCQYKEYENDNLITPKSTLNRNVLMDVENLEPQFFDLLYKTNYCNTICKQLIKRSVMKNINKVDENLNYCEDLACNLEIYKNMKSILFIPDELYIYNMNNSYKIQDFTTRDLIKEIKDTIYAYYSLFSSIKDFDIKNKKEYKKFAAVKMIEKLIILISKLPETNISRVKFKIVLNNITTDKRVEEIYKTLDGEDLGILFNDMKDVKKKFLKQGNLLINKKFNKLYNYNKFFHFLKN